jgi:anti-sigma B factor antagonist
MSKLSAFQSSFFEWRDAAGIAVLQVARPQLTDEDNLELFDRDFCTLTDTYQRRQVVLDMSQVGYMTSAAIGKLITFHRRLSRGGGQLVLCSLQNAVASALSASHLLDYFVISATPEAALDRFS